MGSPLAGVSFGAFFFGTMFGLVGGVRRMKGVGMEGDSESMRGRGDRGDRSSKQGMGKKA